LATSETCSVCGQEVRWGTRAGRTMYHHREVVDHLPVFGNMTSPPVRIQVEDEEADQGVPEIEIPCHPIDPSELPPRSGLRQVANLVEKQGWELRRLTHVRGPYVGAKDKVLSISDVIVLGARGPARLDGTVPVVVGSWRDGKFDFGYIGVIQDGRLSPRKVDATSMKNWIKGIE